MKRGKTLSIILALTLSTFLLSATDAGAKRMIISLAAGMLATFAMLEGAGAEAFLQQESVEYRLIR